MKVSNVYGDDFFECLYRTMPEYFTREEASTLIGGILKPRTLANLDNGRYKLPKYRYGKKVAYRKNEFIPWLRLVLSYTPNAVPDRKTVELNDCDVIDDCLISEKSTHTHVQLPGESEYRTSSPYRPPRTREQHYDSVKFPERPSTDWKWPFA